MQYSRVTFIHLLILPLYSSGMPTEDENTAEWNRLSLKDQEFLNEVQRKAFDYFWEGFDDGYIGVDKGNEVLMIENFRNEGVWRVFMENTYVVAGMEKAKFRNNK